MSELSQNTCEACRSDAPTLSDKELKALLVQIPKWLTPNYNGVQQLERTFTFKNFADAMSFTLAVGNAAEEEGHHPALLLEWGSVKVNWWSHKIKGLHKNDVVMAAKTDELYFVYE